MKIRFPLAAVAIAAAIVAVLTAGCTSAGRYRILSFFFDGVPPPAAAGSAAPAQTGNPTAAVARKVIVGSHGPYAAKMCNACHKSASDNSLVVPKEQLCFRCHEISMNRKYVHGPLSAGGCLSCHDPHGSGNRFLLVADSKNFCTRCHDAAALSATAVHATATGQCVDCHDAHMSDKRFLLR